MYQKPVNDAPGGFGIGLRPAAMVSPIIISMEIRENLNIITYVSSGFSPESMFSCLNKKLSNFTRSSVLPKWNAGGGRRCLPAIHFFIAGTIR